MRAHRKSSIVWAVTLALGAAITLALIIVSPFENESATWLSAFLMIPFTVLCAEGLSSVIDQRETEKDLKILYEDLDPEGFLTVFEPIAEKMKKSSFIEASIHLAEGLMASGESIVARKLIDSLRNRALDVKILVRLDVMALRCSLIGKDRGKALHDAHKFEDLMNSIKALPKERRDEMEAYALPWISLAVDGSMDSMTALFEQTENRLQKLECAYLLSLYTKSREACEYYDNNRNGVSFG